MLTTTNTTLDWERLESELAIGHELMTRLRPLIREPLCDMTRLHLVGELSRVVSSFEVVISILEVLDSHGSGPNSSRKRSGLKKAKNGSAAENATRREVISIRKCSDCIRIVSYAPYDDGYQWRKYGEKIIRNMVHTRTYYRCTHSGCSARKQVQQRDSAGSPPQYDVTYNYDHTCGVPPAFPTPQLLQPPSSTPPFDSRIISFAPNESSTMLNAACDQEMISPQRTDRTRTTTAMSSSVDPVLPDPGSTHDLLMNTSDGAEGDISGACFSPEGPWFGGDALSYDWI